MYQNNNIQKNMVDIKEFHNAYIQSLGIEGAQKLIKETVSEVGLSVKKEYTKEEALKICEALKNKHGLVSIIAGLLSARMMLR